jgi:hypothetical protein
MASVFSKPFIVAQGVSGVTSTVTVPAGHTYVVKQLTCYSNPLSPLTAFFESTTMGTPAIFFAGFPGAAAAWFGFYGAIAFEEGQSFRWAVNAGIGDGADVYAGGYDLVN